MVLVTWPTDKSIGRTSLSINCVFEEVTSCIHSPSESPLGGKKKLLTTGFPPVSAFCVFFRTKTWKYVGYNKFSI